MQKGRVVWITGGGSGIGLAGGIELARAGAHVVISGRSSSTLLSSEKQIKAVGSCESIALDVADQKEVAHAAAGILKRHGRIDILVNSAGLNHPKRSFKNVSIEGWDQIVAVNLSGMFYCVHAVLPGMRERKDGLIINVSSWAGRYASTLTGPGYNSTKTAVVALTESINMEECMNGIRATSVLPGEVATPILEKRPVPPSQEERARMLQAEDLGKTILFIASLPPRACVNEIIVSPTWNRFYLGGLETPKNWIFIRVALPFLAGYFVSYVYRMVNAVLAPTLAAEFGLTAAGLGLLSSIYFLSIAAVQLPVGVALDRFGPRRVNAALLLVAAAGGAWFAVAESAPAAIAARALIGIGVSACLMAALTAFVLWYPPERISTMNGIAFSAGALGAMSVTVPLELLLRVWTWREAFLVIVGTTVAVSAVLWLWVPERSARRANESVGEQMRALGGLLRDPAFLRLGICVGASQCAAVALQTLWIAIWLRDVAGYAPAQVARGLLAVNVAMIVGYLAFGRAADAWQRQGRSALPLLAGGVALSSLSLGAIILGAHFLALWCVFVAGGTAVVLAYSILARRYPREMSGRANTAVNVAGFVGMFSGQWGIGVVLDLWPQGATGYAPEGYPWALGMVWAVQLAGLAWLWSGRRLYEVK